jgi:hypothetical protein
MAGYHLFYSRYWWREDRQAYEKTSGVRKQQRTRAARCGDALGVWPTPRPPRQPLPAAAEFSVFPKKTTG